MLDEVKFGAKKKPSDEKPSSFLSAFYDPLASLNLFSQHLVLCDIYNKGESKLIAANISNGVKGFQLKVYSSTSLALSPSLLALPSAATGFTITTTGVTALAVSAANCIYIYKNMRPFYKYTLPDLDMNEVEREAWIQSRDEKFDYESLFEILNNLLNDQGVLLSQRSKSFLNLKSPDDRRAFGNKYKEQPLSRCSNIVAMTKMNKNIPDDKGISVLIICTEEKEVLILDVSAFTVLKRVTLPSVAVFLDCSGLFDVEYKVHLICRDGHCYSFDRDSDIPKSTFSLSTHAVTLVKIGQYIYTPCTDCTLHIHDENGRLISVKNLKARPLCASKIAIKSKGISGLLIALNDKTINVFRDFDLLENFNVRDNVCAMTFGKYDREDATLVTVFDNGGIEFHIVRRKADFSKKNIFENQSTIANIKMPKMSQAYLEQIEYEKKNAKEILKHFQYDLSYIRLLAARELIRIERKSLAPISTNDAISMSVALLGVGPTFKLQTTISNTSDEIDFQRRYFLSYSYKPSLYKVEQTMSEIPVLAPRTPMTFDCFVRCLSQTGESDTIKVFVSRKKSTKPIISSVVNIPIAEPLSV